MNLNQSNVLSGVRTLFLLISATLVFCCTSQNNFLEDHISIQISTYESDNEIKASALPKLVQDRELTPFERRFEYLLLNVPEFHSSQMTKERKRLFGLYPDTLKMKKKILEKYTQDEEFSTYFEQTLAAIKNPAKVQEKSFTTDEMMRVASRFFYCDAVNPDTTVQSRVCVELNGVDELIEGKDVTLLAAFCYEAIFNDFDRAVSPVSAAWNTERKRAVERYKPSITSFEIFLEDVKQELYDRMERNNSLKQILVEHYKTHKDNLPFELTE